MIQMQTNLDVADNSGARRVMCIKVLGGSQAQIRHCRRHHRRLGEGSDSARPREEGRGDEGRGGAHRQGHQRADGSVIRFDRNAAVLINAADRAGRHPHLRAGAARTARQEPHEDHFARAGGAVMAAKIKKGDKVIVLAGRDKGRTGEVIEVRPDRRPRAGARRQHGQAPSAPDRAAGGRHHLQGERRSICPTWRMPIPRTASRRASASNSSAKGETARVRFAKRSGVRSMADTQAERRKPRSRSAARRARRAPRTAARPKATRRRSKKPRERSDYVPRLQDAFRGGHPRRADQAVRLQEPHAGAEDQQGRAQHGHRRRRRRPQEGRQRRRTI